MLQGEGLDGQDHLRCRHQGILTLIHRRGAGVVRLTAHTDREAALANNALNNTNAVSTPLEHGALLHMQFDEGGDGVIAASGTGQPVPIPPETGQVALDRLTVTGGVIAGVSAGGAGHALAAHHRGLLVGEDDQLEGVAELERGVLKRANHFQARQDTEGAVVAPPGWDRVEVRAGHEGWKAGVRTLQPANQIASGIDAQA